MQLKKNNTERCDAVQDELFSCSDCFRILDKLNYKIYIADEQYNLLYINKSFHDLYGDAKGRSCFEVLAGRNSPCSWCRFPEIENGTSVTWRWCDPVHHKIYDVSDICLRKKTGSPLLLKAMQDVTNYVQSEEKLRDLSFFPEENPYPVLRIDQSGTVRYMNRVALTLFGSGYEEILNSLRRTVVRLLEEKPDVLRKIELKINKKVYSFDLVPVLHKDYLNLYGHEVTRSKKRIHQLKEEKAQAVKDIRQKDSEIEGVKNELINIKRLADIGTLGAMVAHELKNPLGVIRTAAFNLQRKIEDKGLDRHFNNINSKVNESIRIVDNLLQYSRLKQPRIQPLSVRKIIEDSLQTVVNQYPEKRVNLKICQDKKVDVKASADPIQIKEVFINLFLNSYQAVDFGTGTIEVIIQMDKDKENVFIYILDNGPGISAGNIDRIYEPFFTTKEQGSGLGLAICSEIIHMHQGQLEITNREPYGVRVWISLPSACPE